MASSSLHILLGLSFLLRSCHAARARFDAEIGQLSPRVTENLNLGKDCWQSGCRGGPCPYCGSGFCCRMGSFRGGCDGSSGHKSKHVCTPAPPNATDPRNLGKECWNAADCRSGRCGYCGSGMCCRMGWAEAECSGKVGGVKAHECVSLQAPEFVSLQAPEFVTLQAPESLDSFTPPPRGWKSDIYLNGFRADSLADMLAKKHGWSLRTAIEHVMSEFPKQFGTQPAAPPHAAGPPQQQVSQDMEDTGHQEVKGQEKMQFYVGGQFKEWNPDAVIDTMGGRAGSLAAQLVNDYGLTLQEAQKQVMSLYPGQFEPIVAIQPSHGGPEKMQFYVAPQLRWNPNADTKGGHAGSLAAYLVKEYGLTAPEAQKRIMSLYPAQFHPGVAIQPSHEPVVPEQQVPPEAEVASEHDKSQQVKAPLKMQFHVDPRFEWNPRIRTDVTGVRAGALAAYFERKDEMTPKQAQQKVMSMFPAQFGRTPSIHPQTGGLTLIHSDESFTRP